jgi:hypothetical protein
LSQGLKVNKIAYIGKDNTAIIRCDLCQRTKALNLAPYGDIREPLRVRVKCACGHLFSSVLEQRRVWRKAVDLRGFYVHYVEGEPKGKGALKVVDLSSNGLKLVLPPGETVSVGDMLKVEFRLDDPRLSLIKKRLIIRNVQAQAVGAEFASTELLDTALGFYLMS